MPAASGPPRPFPGGGPGAQPRSEAASVPANAPTANASGRGFEVTVSPDSRSKAEIQGLSQGQGDVGRHGHPFRLRPGAGCLVDGRRNDFQDPARLCKSIDIHCSGLFQATVVRFPWWLARSIRSPMPFGPRLEARHIVGPFQSYKFIMCAMFSTAPSSRGELFIQQGELAGHTYRFEAIVCQNPTCRCDHVTLKCFTEMPEASLRAPSPYAWRWILNDGRLLIYRN
jgi:hypothetical protein